MDRKIRNSSAIMAKIFKQKAQGETLETIAEVVGTDINTIGEILRKAVGFKTKSKKSRRHKLNQNDKARGGIASQKTKAKQYQFVIETITGILETKGKVVELAAATYYLRKGSKKEFSIALINEPVGMLIIKALCEVGVPDDSMILFYGKWLVTDFEKEKVRNEWGVLGEQIVFSDRGSKGSLFLKVKAFSLEIGVGTIKVSSRAFALAFYNLGERVIKDAAE